METGLYHESLGHYLAAIGVIGLCEVGSRWVNGYCEFGAPLEEILQGCESALSGRGLWPLHETDHPLWCNRGRRSIQRGVEEARSWLKNMKPEQRRAELHHLIEGSKEAMRLSIPKGPRPNPNWNIGTLIPAVLGDVAPLHVSAWVPILAWEAQRLVLTNELRAPVGSPTGALVGDVYSWQAIEWHEPLTVAEVFVLLSGGVNRWHYVGQSIQATKRYYHLRDTAGGGKTKEFCTGESFVVVLE